MLGQWTVGMEVVDFKEHGSCKDHASPVSRCRDSIYRSGDVLLSMSVDDRERRWQGWGSDCIKVSQPSALPARPLCLAVLGVGWTPTGLGTLRLAVLKCPLGDGWPSGREDAWLDTLTLSERP